MMAIEALQAIGPTAAASVDRAAMAADRAQPAASSFADWLGAEVDNVDERIRAADGAVRQLALGENVELHRVMMTIEQARISFELLVQVRNKVVEAYQEVMRMQV
jgi:flagellar hook-basal body complex protein FliE